MERLAFVVVDSFYTRQGWHRKQTYGSQDKSTADLSAIFKRQTPNALVLVKNHLFDITVELHVIAQSELVRNKVQILQSLGLR